MRKTLFSTSNNFAIAILLLAAIVLPGFAKAQCGLNAFSSGAAVTPSTAWQSLTNVGSGTYVDFNITSGNIYSFRYTSGTASGSGYAWDMTLSTTSTAISYNNSLTPVRDPWTGGEFCPRTSRPGSLDWYSTAGGTVRVNTNTWDGTNCQGWVSGQGSATLEYKVCNPAADPGSGTNTWNVEAFATTDLGIPVPNARYGYYVDNNLNFITANSWSAFSNPSTAPGWTGCEVPNDNFTVRARRTGFPCGIYRMVLDSADDKFSLALNGNTLYTTNSVANNVTIGNPAGYVLGPNDNIDIRLVGQCSSDKAYVRFVPVATPPVTGGTIGGVPNNSYICEGVVPGTFTNVTSAGGGTTTFVNGGTITYDWEASINGGPFTSLGISTPTYSPTSPVPSGSVFTVRRRATDRCGNTTVSNSITINGISAPNGTMTPSNQTVCPGTFAVITLHFNSGIGPFNVSYSDGVSTYSRNNRVDGDTIHVIPINASTIYTYTYMYDVNTTCQRSSNFTSGAQVQTVPAINVANVVVGNVGCNGASDGTITINATGGQAPLSYSIDGGGTYQPSNSFTGLAANSYIVNVRDNFGCSQAYGNNPVVVGQPTDVTHTTTTTDASCANVFDGTITVTAAGGTPPYSYSLNYGPTQPGNIFGNVGAGTYVVGVYDSHGCVDTSSATISNSYVVSLSVDTQTDVSCYAGADGSLTVHLNGGLAPYSYSINGVTYQPTPTFTGLTAGNYIVSGRDARGCTEFANVTIAQPAAVSISIDSVSNIACYGGNSGGIYITVRGGTPGYTYNWSNSVNTEDNIGIPAGVYNVTVIDSKGCISSAGATITQPLELFVNVAQYNSPLCNADSTGAIDITANGGVPPYNYSWNNGATTEDINHLAAGTYTATVTDANGCQKTITQVLTDPTALVSSVVGTDVTCNGANDGVADLTVSGGTTPYYFQWSTFQTSEDITGLDGGLYYVITNDANGCQIRDSALINEPAPLLLSTVVTNITCFNSNDGAIDLTVTGGTTPYTYAWSNGATTEDLSNLGGGTYAVTVTDAHGCTAATSVLLVNPSAINTSFVVKTPLCYSDTNGFIDLIPSGGTAPYTYAWSNGDVNEDLNNIPAGVYHITITDAKGCTKVDSTEVTQPEPLVTSGVIKNVTCFGYQDGAVDITAYGGTLPYYFHWSSGESTEDIFNKAGGNYIVTVTDANGCNASTLYPILEPTQLTATAVGTNSTCYNSNNAHVAVIPGGGTTPYEYLWNNFVTDSAQYGIGAGRYVVLVTDSNGCHVYDSIEVTQPAQIGVTGTVTNAGCFAAATGGVDITVTGGNAPYTYVWTGGSTNEDLTNVAAGTYTVTVTDAGGCTVTATYVITQPQGIFSTVSVGNPICPGATNGYITVDVTGGAIPYTYSWNTTPVQTGNNAFNLGAGNYNVTITDGNNCTAVASGTLTDPTPIVVTANGTDAKCYNTPSGTVVATATGGTPPYVYELNGVIQLSDSFVGLTPGQYVIAVRDANGCQGTDVFTIASPSQITVDLTTPQSVILDGMTTQLLADAVSSSPVVNYFWGPASEVFDFSNCGDSTNCYNPYVTPHFTTTYTVTVMNQDSCFASDTVSIIVEIEPKLFVPSAFTPNGDGLNDFFEFDVLGATTVDIQIFDRWGALLYNNPAQPNGITGTNGWDGKKDGTLVPFDTYVYQMKVTYYDGKIKDIAGTVTIMK